MKCPTCTNDLLKSKLDNFETGFCNACRGMWFDSFTFEEFKEVESPFSVLLDIDIWKDAKKHKVSPSTKTCPQCTKRLYKTEYSTSGIILDICPICQGIWFDRGELEKVISYIDKEISDETISALWGELGNEVKEFLIGQESIEKEIKHVGLILKLMEYKVFSQFPVLQDIANSMPL
ncbi:MAG: zf-TFIIB domain-containing protein [Candidatus Aureabacteria bacterium]|nr:zf-TFIIB domain-containing protein [Candidatus Auribacterota bacterium]